MQNNSLPRLDKDAMLREHLLKYCRLKKGEIWHDPHGIHKVGCLDIGNSSEITGIMDGQYANLAIQDPPYNFVAFKERKVHEFILWCQKWIGINYKYLDENSSLYVWLGADQKNHFQPFSDFVNMMKSSGFDSKSFITMRNQRGYGTQKNWMSVRQELLYYIKGNPIFNIEEVYTDIPKILRGYYKNIGGKKTENIERSKSEFIRASNVWVDIQQVFYLLEENVNGCFAQKPLKAIERIIKVSSAQGDLVIDFFSHAGTTLIASEILNRKCFTIDIDPIFAEITIRRLENFRSTGKTGWQNSNPFKNEIENDNELRGAISTANLEYSG